jgi:hypothetical protein
VLLVPPHIYQVALLSGQQWFRLKPRSEAPLLQFLYKLFTYICKPSHHFLMFARYHFYEHRNRETLLRTQY